MNPQPPTHCPLELHSFRPFTVYHQRRALGYVFKCQHCPKLKIVTVPR